MDKGERPCSCSRAPRGAGCSPHLCWGISVTLSHGGQGLAASHAQLRALRAPGYRKKGVHCPQQWVSESPLDWDFTVSAGQKGAVAGDFPGPRGGFQLLGRLAPGSASVGVLGTVSRLTAHQRHCEVELGEAGGQSSPSRCPRRLGGRTRAARACRSRRLLPATSIPSRIGELVRHSAS